MKKYKNIAEEKEEEEEKGRGRSSLTRRYKVTYFGGCCS